MLNRLLPISLLLGVFLLLLPHYAYSQEDLLDEASSNCFETSYRIDRVYPAFWKTRSELYDVEKIGDLNPHYKPEWVRQYLQVELSAITKGKVKKAYSRSEFFTSEQLLLMKSSDFNSNIKISVSYIPENNLLANDEQHLEFNISIEPNQTARFSGGDSALDKYLVDELSMKVPLSSFKQYQLAAVSFTINEQGNVTNAKIFSSTDNEKLDASLLKCIENMPTWFPAEFPDGQKVSQEFVLRVGDMTSCVSNTLNLDRKLHPLPEID